MSDRKSKSKRRGRKIELIAVNSDQLSNIIADMLTEISEGEGVSTFEFVRSGIVETLLNYFWVGIAAYRPLSKDNNNVLFLHDDGSLQILSFGMGSGTRGLELHRHDCSINSEQVKMLGPGLLSNTANAGINPEFPLDFFEKTNEQALLYLCCFKVK